MAVDNMKLLVCLLLTTNLAYGTFGLIRDDYGNLRPLKKWLPQYVELDNEKGMEMGISTSEGPTRVRLYPKQGFNNPEQVNHYLRAQRNDGKIRRDSERDHYFRTLKRSLPKDKIIFQDEGDSVGPRYDIAVAQDNNGGSWYAVVPKIPEMNHYFRTMRSSDKAQQRNVNRDHYLRSM